LKFCSDETRKKLDAADGSSGFFSTQASDHRGKKGESFVLSEGERGVWGARSRARVARTPGGVWVLGYPPSGGSLKRGKNWKGQRKGLCALGGGVVPGRGGRRGGKEQTCRRRMSDVGGGADLPFFGGNQAKRIECDWRQTRQRKANGTKLREATIRAILYQKEQKGTENRWKSCKNRVKHLIYKTTNPV